MVLKAVVGLSGGFRPLGLNHLKGPSSASPVSKRLEVSKFGRLECGGICMKPIDDENATSSSSLDVKREMGNGGEDLRRWHSDLASLPRSESTRKKVKETFADFTTSTYEAETEETDDQDQGT